MGKCTVNHSIAHCVFWRNKLKLGQKSEREDNGSDRGNIVRRPTLLIACVMFLLLVPNI